MIFIKWGVEILLITKTIPVEHIAEFTEPPWIRCYVRLWDGDHMLLDDFFTWFVNDAVPVGIDILKAVAIVLFI